MKVILFRDDLLGMIEWEQLALEGDPEFGVQLQAIDFALYAKAYGVTGYTVEDPTQVGEVLRQAFAQPGPVVVQAIVDPLEPPLPGTITFQQDDRREQSARGHLDRFIRCEVSHDERKRLTVEDGYRSSRRTR